MREDYVANWNLLRKYKLMRSYRRSIQADLHLPDLHLFIQHWVSMTDISSLNILIVAMKFIWNYDIAIVPRKSKKKGANFCEKFIGIKNLEELK